MAILHIPLSPFTLKRQRLNKLNSHFLLCCSPPHEDMQNTYTQSQQIKNLNFLKSTNDVLNPTIPDYLVHAGILCKELVINIPSEFIKKKQNKTNTYMQSDLKDFIHCIFLLETDIYFAKFTRPSLKKQNLADCNPTT